MGFEHWGDSVVVALDDAKVGDVYKVNDTFITQVVNIEEEEGKKKVETYGYLLMGEDTREMKDLAKAASDDPKTAVSVWDEVDASAGPVKLDDKLITIEGEGKAAVATLVPTGEKLTASKTATMLDWMNYYSCNVMNPKVLVGVFLGAMATFVFCAMTMKAVGRAAFGMVEEVRRQFKEKPGIMEGTDKPDYAAPVAISTKAAQREMILPSMLGLVTPIATGLLLGVAGVMGLLVGTLTCGFCVAVFMANAVARGTTPRSTSKPAPTAAKAPTPTRRPSSATPSAIRSRTPAVRA
jgi:K(+)-stimulated pyrophosphate-energized sodium pump